MSRYGGKTSQGDVDALRERLSLTEVELSPEVGERLYLELCAKIRWALGSTLSRPYGKSSRLGRAGIQSSYELWRALQKEGLLHLRM